MLGDECLDVGKERWCAWAQLIACNYPHVNARCV
jgi:hypothetical protein